MFEVRVFFALRRNWTRLNDRFAGSNGKLILGACPCPLWVISRHIAAQKVMSALPLKADMCSALADVRLVPRADILVSCSGVCLCPQWAAFNALGSSCCQRLITPATAAPRMGASQNNQSCAIYGPPASSAGPVLRAGLTEALVTGIRKR